MKLLQINATCGIGSTGKICLAVSQRLNEMQIENYILYSNGKSDYECASKYEISDKYLKLQALCSRVFGNLGFNSRKLTSKLIDKIKKISPDVIHLHNLHSHNCNLTMLFEYLKTTKIKLYWTFHDCWTFTAYCTHFDLIGCDKWQSECHKCPQYKDSSWFFDRSRKIFNEKKRLFTGLDLTIITPSQWLASKVKASMFKDYPVKVINNGVDLDIFKPTPSDFKIKHSIEDKKIVLGVAFGWGYKKGLDALIELSRRLPSEYQVVLVGTNDKIDKELPNNIISIHRTSNQRELAEIYTAADVFVNPTREEVLGLTNIEALGCGTPVITFNAGGSPECVNEKCGSVIEIDDIDGLEKEVIRICEQKPFKIEHCFEKARQFDKNKIYKEYADTYTLK